MNRRTLSQKLLPRFSTYCVGSLPYVDPKEALNFVFEHDWIVPFWPELPLRRDSELMLSRAERVLTSGWNGYAEAEAACLFALRDRLESASTGLDIIKCQVLGPLSFLLYSQQLQGTFKQRIQEAAKITLQQIRWQHRFLESFCDDFIFVVDEPGLIEWSALDVYERRMLQEAYSYLFVSVSELEAFMGMHSCSAFDHEFLSFPIELLSFDALQFDFTKLFPHTARNAWSQAAERGLVVAPGLFAARNESPELLAVDEGRKLTEQFRQQYAEASGASGIAMLASATCGHAFASRSWVELLYQNEL